MKKNLLSKIGFNLIIISGGVLLFTFFFNFKGDWINYLLGLTSLIGLILSYVGKRKN